MPAERTEPKAMERCGGYTLSEMVFVVAIVAATLGYGVPAFRDLGLDASRTREVNFFVHALYLARSEAIKRNGVVSLCPSSNGELCAAAGTPWHSGWIVFVNGDRDQPAVRDAGEELLRTQPARWNGSVAANRATLSFRPFGQSGTTATFVFCDRRGDRFARAVIVSQTGRPRVSSRDSSGESLSCS
jgi:type IV fimbrial biogenesis protein FimT